MAVVRNVALSFSSCTIASVNSSRSTTPSDLIGVTRRNNLHQVNSEPDNHWQPFDGGPILLFVILERVSVYRIDVTSW